MRLFTALWPDAAANDDVDARLAVTDLTGWRTSPPESRHVTLCFHGDADPDTLADRLEAADLGDAAGLRLRCRGAGVFGGGASRNRTLWLGVEADDPGRLAVLVGAAGGDPDTHVAHLTIARGRALADGVPSSLPTGPGPWWSVTAVDLVAGGLPYRTTARVDLPSGDTGILG